MHYTRFFGLLCILGSFSYAQTLSDALDEALLHDPTYQSATAAYLAAKQAVPQAVSVMLPSIYAKASVTHNYPELNNLDYYTLRQDQLSLSQPLFNVGQWIQLSEANTKVQQAQAAYADALQDLIVRLAQRYFAVLAAANDVHFAKAQSHAFAHHLDQAQHRFQAGLITRTDVQDAQARYDSAVAKVITADHALNEALEHLTEMTNHVYTEKDAFPLQVRTEKLAPPTPQNIDAWVDAAVQHNYRLKMAQFSKEAAKLEVHRQRSGHWPTVSLDGSVVRNNHVPNQLAVSSASVGVNVTLPILQGGGVISRTREAQAYYQQAQADYDAAYKQVVSQTRRAYRSIEADISGAHALTQAVASSEAAMQAIAAAYAVGARSMDDTLDAQANVLDAENARAKVYYDYFLQRLILKQTTGMLSPADVAPISAALVVAPADGQ